jgi:hypothetical protein
MKKSKSLGRTGFTRLVQFRLKIYRRLWPVKITAIFMLAACLQVSALGFSQSITLTQKNISRSKIFEGIHNQTGLNFLYNAEWLNQLPNLDIDVNNATIEEVLSICFKDLPLSYSIIENTIVVKQEANKGGNMKSAIKQDQVTISGSVRTQNGLPLPGVNILIKGSTRGTSTDGNGNYSVKIENSDKFLVFSSVGMKPQEESINGRLVIDVFMEEDAITMSDVVVVSTGYQRINKERSAGSFVQLNRARPRLCCQLWRRK